MRFDLFKGSLDTSRTTIAIQLGLLAISGLLNVALAWAVVALVGNDRTIVVPPAIEKSFWVEKDRVSAHYLEQMGGYIAYLSMHATPTTVDFQSKQLLEYVSPAAYGRLKQELALAAGNMRKNNISQSFVVKALQVNEAKQRVEVTGDLATSVNDRLVSTGQSDVIIDFQVVQGKLYVMSIKASHSAVDTAGGAGATGLGGTVAAPAGAVPTNVASAVPAALAGSAAAR